jgi:GxxExxY protein
MKDYKKALFCEIWDKGLSCSDEVPTIMKYKGIELRRLRMDLLVADKIIVELKANVPVTMSHKTQLLTYLKTTNKKLGLLIYFNPSGVTVKRVINS